MFNIMNQLISYCFCCFFTLILSLFNIHNFKFGRLHRYFLSRTTTTNVRDTTHIVALEANGSQHTTADRNFNSHLEFSLKKTCSVFGLSVVKGSLHDKSESSAGSVLVLVLVGHGTTLVQKGYDLWVKMKTSYIKRSNVNFIVTSSCSPKNAQKISHPVLTEEQNACVDGVFSPSRTRLISVFALFSLQPVLTFLHLHLVYICFPMRGIMFQPAFIKC